MEKKTIDQKQAEINKKVADAKKKVAKKAEKPKDTETSWLQNYIANPEQSGAKKVTALFARPEGCSVDEAVRVATEYGQKKGSKWGQSSGSIKSHISFLKGKGVKIAENDGIYKIQG